MSIGLDIQGIILFFIFIVPGFSFTRTYLSYRPRYYKEPNVFEQIALALIGSAVIHATFLLAITFAVLIVWFATGQTTSIGMLIGPLMPFTEYPLPVLALYLNVSAGYLLLSLLAARRFGIFLGKQARGSRPKWWEKLAGEDPPDSLLLWYIILQEEPLKKGILNPCINVHLRNGDCFEGYLNGLKLAGDEENTIELAINNVSYRSGKEHPASDMTALPNQTVLLQSKDILWLSRSDTL